MLKVNSERRSPGRPARIPISNKVQAAQTLVAERRALLARASPADAPMLIASFRAAEAELRAAEQADKDAAALARALAGAPTVDEIVEPGPEVLAAREALAGAQEALAGATADTDAARVELAGALDAGDREAHDQATADLAWHGGQVARIEAEIASIEAEIASLERATLVGWIESEKAALKAEIEAEIEAAVRYELNEAPGRLGLIAHRRRLRANHEARLARGRRIGHARAHLGDLGGAHSVRDPGREIADRIRAELSKETGIDDAGIHLRQWADTYRHAS